MESIAQQIYERQEYYPAGRVNPSLYGAAKDYSLPRRELEKTEEDARAVLTQYLKLHNQKLYPYKGKEDVYYFDDPVTGKRISNVLSSDWLWNTTTPSLSASTTPIWWS